jgi:protein-S-isoprenylcysteine O-methyltransferase Ste14
MDNRTERPNTVPWPPIIFVCAAVLAFWLGRAYPIGGSLLAADALRVLGVVGMFAGLGLDIAAMRTLRQSRANILPHRAATALVTTGPFARSRNPIYLGNTLLLAGAGLAFANAWFLLAAGIASQAVIRLAIRREEAHLAASFGAEWRSYARRTPRWLRFSRRRS